MKLYPFLFTIVMFIMACNQNKSNIEYSSLKESKIHYNQEVNLYNIKQLTNGGDNAEAYFSFDNSKVVFQSNNESWGLSCDQIFYFNLTKDNLFIEKPNLISTGKGRTTCSYFLPGDTSILFASTHLGSNSCPKTPERKESDPYAWPIYDDYDIFISNLNGNIIDTLTNYSGYDAEATVSPKGDKIVFTSTRSGDLELFTMDINGENITQITNKLGYDGGAFFSPNGEKIIFRASRPNTEEEIKKYKDLLAKGLVEPTKMELFICDIDGSNLTQITDLGNANWAPFFHPSGEKVIFSSNHASPKGFPFNLYIIDINGENLQQVTFDDVFDAFPMFSPDGKKLIFSSNRNNGGGRATNLFIADWKD